MIDVDKGHLPSLYSSLLLEPDVSMIRHYTLALHLCETDKDLSETVRSSMTRTVRKLLLTVAVTPSTGEFVAELMYFHPNVAVDLLLTQNFAEDEGVTVAMNVADAVVRLEKVPGYGRTAANAQVQVCRVSELVDSSSELNIRLLETGRSAASQTDSISYPTSLVHRFRQTRGTTVPSWR
ncbi:MAG: hypothetical protein KVP17_003429 [Porospora cf. gigantea B]|uniref:uncharacterized protein n=1 Tax=Porospora cf. gigantea B TaxID=2853592 RepID=UPI003571B4A3|nr:MAG: hypothetical protein KVP17_003429 [Porospora cf. gigantea B]